MTILITGGTGKTGLPLAKIAQAANWPVLLASRSGSAPEPFKGVKFDWTDPTSFENPFKADPNIDRVYIIAPPGVQPFPLVKPFIDLAVSKGVKRFVLLTASQIEAGGPVGGQIHKYLIDVGVDYTVLRPTWFMENFATRFCQGIQEKDHLATATDDGRVPFIAAQDISQAAFNALTAEKSPNTDYIVVGPELLTYDDAAKLLSAVLGREITHKKIHSAEAQAIYLKFGLPEEFAARLAAMEGKVADGSEAQMFFADRKIVGKRTLKEYFEANKDLWLK